MRVIVDADTCIACDLCADICPDVFETGPDGKAVVKVETVSPECEDAAADAAQQCPVEAIKIET